MRYKLLTGFMALLLFAGYAGAQQVPNRAGTYMEMQMYQTTSTDELGTLYNSLTTEYDRRYFLLALPGYFAERKIQTAAPAWVTTAILNGLKSKDPLCVHNAAVAAGALGINCATELMAVYKTVRSTFGSHQVLIESAILGALCGMNDPNKQTFLNDVLSNEYFPLASGSFGALLSALETAKSPSYLPKLKSYSDTLDSLSIRLGTAKEQAYHVQRLRTIQARINRLRNEIGGN